MYCIVSIIIPHYRCVPSLLTLLNTIPDVPEIQVVVVDDNSFDENKIVSDAIDSLKRYNVELYYNCSKRGAGACRNIGLDHAKGEWVVFADSDDYFLENAFDLMLLMSNREEDIIYFIPQSVNMPEKTVGTRHIPYKRMIESYLENDNELNDVNLRYGFVVPWSKMIRFNLILDNNIKFDEIRWSNDVMFSVRCAFKANKIFAEEQSIYCVTRESGSLTTQKSKEEYITRFEVYVNKFTFIRDHEKPVVCKQVLNAPIGKVINALLQGYGFGMAKYILKRYSEEKIPLFFWGRNSMHNYVIERQKTRYDYKYISKDD